MATCHYENQGLLWFCTQLSTVGANEASLTLSVQQIFGSDIPLSFSPLPDIKGNPLFYGSTIY